MVSKSSGCSFERATPDFQSSLGYEVDKPGQADMTISSNAVRYLSYAVTGPPVCMGNHPCTHASMQPAGAVMPCCWERTSRLKYPLSHIAQSQPCAALMQACTA